MTREDVIKGLECCMGYGIEDTPGCEDCPYNDMGDTCERIRPLYEDALTLLKAQEPVEPVLDIDTWKCGNCRHALEHQQLLGDNVLLHEQYDYCPECGRAVKWE